MRLFTGIDLPAETLDAVDRLLQQLRPAARLKWSLVSNLHVTVKFIGEWPEDKLPQLEGALRTIPPRAAAAAELKGLGWYPNPHHPRVFRISIEAGDSLASLLRDTETALAPLGIAKEERAYSAHLTLARVKDSTPLQALRDAIAQLDSHVIGQFVADRFYLYRSQPGPAGSIYTKLSEYPFQAA